MNPEETGTVSRWEAGLEPPDPATNGLAGPGAPVTTSERSSGHQAPWLTDLRSAPPSDRESARDGAPGAPRGQAATVGRELGSRSADPAIPQAAPGQISAALVSAAPRNETRASESIRDSAAEMAVDKALEMANPSHRHPALNPSALSFSPEEEQELERGLLLVVLR